MLKEDLHNADTELHGLATDTIKVWMQRRLRLVQQVQFLQGDGNAYTGSTGTSDQCNDIKEVVRPVIVDVVEVVLVHLQCLLAELVVLIHLVSPSVPDVRTDPLAKDGPNVLSTVRFKSVVPLLVVLYDVKQKPGHETILRLIST